jgi:hypothetical protein
VRDKSTDKELEEEFTGIEEVEELEEELINDGELRCVDVSINEVVVLSLDEELEDADELLISEVVSTEEITGIAVVGDKSTGKEFEKELIGVEELEELEEEPIGDAELLDVDVSVNEEDNKDELLAEIGTEGLFMWVEVWVLTCCLLF